MAWNWIYPPYVAMDAILVLKFYFADWDAISHSIRIREGMMPEAFHCVHDKSYGAIEDSSTMMCDEDEKKIDEV